MGHFWTGLLMVFCLLVNVNNAAIATMTYVPQGNNPLLYQPGAEPIMHLDQVTFADTVFDPTKRTSFVVEFYADWCGHCRAFAPYYREFAGIVASWNEVTRVAAINCADAFNSQVCRDNGVAYFPMIKYFPRHAQHYADGLNMEASHSGVNLRDQVSSKVLNEYSRMPYQDWPNFHYLEVNSNTRYEDLWAGVPSTATHLVIIFEQYDGAGAEFMLNIFPYRAVVGGRRALSSTPLVQMLQITSFPYVAMFRRNDQQAVFMGPYLPSTLQEVLNRAQPGQVMITPAPVQTTTRKIDVIDCEKDPERCAGLYFASETDMLKAMYSALHDEVVRANDRIDGQNFTNLYNFVSLLSEHFPALTFANSGTKRRTARQSVSMILKKSERARMVFAHMKQYLDQKSGSVLSQDWLNQFESVERVYGHPFPVNATWQHCAGSSPEYRGYTCGLWTTFHTLTVHTYMDTIKNKKINPLKPLKAIQGWVNSFFGCQHCKNHFMHMTTTLFPMTDRRVRHNHDMIMYLWRAHNIVNNRLHGDTTEDPQFTKYQFPPLFLCPTCHSGGHFSRRQVRNFLLRYYANIRPHHWSHSL
uniref:Sulfhydryl oxidase n=1 Tax=Panagrolaimus sp. JU765 TaxID=591449 RepID=A0AC34QA09_9BILA